MMTSNVRESSKEAFRERIRSGKQRTDTNRIAQFILDVNRCSNMQIAKELDMVPGTVSGIVRQLVKAKVIYQTAARSPCPITGRRVHFLIHMSRFAGEQASIFDKAGLQ